MQGAEQKNYFFTIRPDLPDFLSRYNLAKTGPRKPPPGSDSRKLAS